jgi:hypothetical protein
MYHVNNDGSAGTIFNADDLTFRNYTINPASAAPETYGFLA